MNRISGPWKSEFVQGVDFEILSGQDLKAFLEVYSESLQTSKYAGRLMILSASGLDTALLLAKTDKGRRLRRLVTDHVLPQLRATGVAVLPGADLLGALRAENERQRVDFLHRLDEQELRFRGLLQEQQEVYRFELTNLRSVLSRSPEPMGATWAREHVNEWVEERVEALAVLPKAKSRKSLRRSIYNLLNRLTGWGERDRPYSCYPSDPNALSDLERHKATVDRVFVQGLTEEARREARARRAAIRAADEAKRLAREKARDEARRAQGVLPFRRKGSK